MYDDHIPADYVENTVEEAIEKGWIQVYLQPLIRSQSNELCGAEALVRWEDPKYGRLMPSYFIPILEKEQKINLIDLHVAKTVCEFLHIEKREFDIPISINLSRVDFYICDIIEDIHSLVVKNGLSTSQINLEVTESILQQDKQVMTEIIDKAHRLDYRVLMDDFGSGYSSLNVLKDFDFDCIKLDMQFLQSMSERSIIIMETIVGLAQRLGMSTVIEGVETEEQYDLVKRLKFDRAQGYYFSRPVKIDEAKEIFRKKFPFESSSKS